MFHIHSPRISDLSVGNKDGRTRYLFAYLIINEEEKTQHQE